MWQAVIAKDMNDQRPKRETVSIEQIIPQATYDKIKDQVVAKQKSLWDRSGLGRGMKINH